MRAIRVIATAAGVLVRWVWALILRILAFLRRRPAIDAQQNDVRRRYVFGAVSRQTFDSARRNVRRPFARRRRA